jgi:streptogramin lyase
MNALSLSTNFRIPRSVGWPPSLFLLFFALFIFSQTHERLSGKTSIAHDDHYIIDNWDVEDGIRGNQILSITQTSDGFIWLGTFYGIARFDGLHFTVFDDTTQGLSGGACYKILPGPDGSHWTAPGGKLTFYQNGESQLVSHLPSDLRYAIGLLCVTPDGRIVFSRRDFETGYYSLFTANVEKLSQHAERVPKDLGSNIHFQGDTDDQGQVWWRFQNEFGKLTPDGTTIEAHIPAPSKITLGPISAISGGVWFAIDGRVRRFHEGRWIDNELAEPEAIGPQILELVEDELGNIWIRTKQGKLRHYACGPDGSYRLTNQLDVKIGGNLLVDRERRLWAAGGIGGIGISRLRKRAFRNLNNNPILSGPIHSFLQTDNGELLIRSNRGLTRLSRDQLTFPVKAVNNRILFENIAFDPIVQGLIKHFRFLIGCDENQRRVFVFSKV